MIRAKRPEGPNAASFNKRSYPIYDGHGNVIATLAKVPGAGTPPVPGTYTIENVKKYDVWGAVRASSGAGTHVVNPNKQYCANLGHTFDGESDLIYMRARYYEQSSGRFISEDPAYDGHNWFTYCRNTPTILVDGSGKSPAAWAWGALHVLAGGAGIWAGKELAQTMWKSFMAYAAANGPVGADILGAALDYYNNAASGTLTELLTGLANYGAGLFLEGSVAAVSATAAGFAPLVGTFLICFAASFAVNFYMGLLLVTVAAVGGEVG